MRQLAAAPDTTRVEAFASYARGPGSAELLRVVRETPSVLIADPSKELRTFRVAQDAPLGTKRGQGKGTFIESVIASVDAFYETVVSRMRAWTATPPKLRNAESPEPVATRLISTSISSQDGPEEAGQGEPLSALATEPVVDKVPSEPAEHDTASSRDLTTAGIDGLELTSAPTREPSRRELRLARAPEPDPQVSVAVQEAGWYRDPEGGDTLRWHDGRAWTEHTYPKSGIVTQDGQTALA